MIRAPIKQHAPTSTPWGMSDYTREVGDGVTFYATPSHGGYLLSPERRAAMPEPYRSIPTFAGGNWYEEDCDWALVALSFPKLFAPSVQRIAEAMYINVHVAKFAPAKAEGKS